MIIVLPYKKLQGITALKLAIIIALTFFYFISYSQDIPKKYDEKFHKILASTNKDSIPILLYKLQTPNAKKHYSYYCKLYSSLNEREYKDIKKLLFARLYLIVDSFKISEKNVLELLKNEKFRKNNYFNTAIYKLKAHIAMNLVQKDSMRKYFNLYINANNKTANDTVRIEEYDYTSVIFRRKGMYDEAIKYLNNAYTLSMQKKINNSLTSIYVNFYELYKFTGFDSIAKEYYNKAIQSIPNNEFETWHSTIIKIVPTIFKNNDVKNIAYLTKLYDSVYNNKSVKDTNSYLACRRFYAYKHMYQKKYEQAINIFLENLKIKKSSFDPIHAYYIKDIAECYNQLGDISNMQKYYDSCIYISQKLGLTQLPYETLPEYIKVLQQNKLWQKSSLMQNYYTETLNEINTERNLAKLTFVQNMYDVQNKEQTIALLKNQNSIQEVENKRQKMFQLLLALSSILAFSFMGYFLYSYRKSKRTNLLLQKQKNDIEHQGKQLMQQAAALSRFKSQMNPHFIYNAINSVQSLALKNKDIELFNYLQDFSKLMRATLDNSEKEYIRLDEEISYLKNYINFEQKKLDKNFIVHFNIDKSLDETNILIPPMLIQPQIENAIKHAVPHTEKCIINVSFRDYDTQLLKITISDNGPGISKNNFQIHSQMSHISKANTITEQRVNELLKKFNITHEGYTIANNIETGTGVIVTIYLPKVLEF